MTHSNGSIGQGQDNWCGERSQVLFPMEFVDFHRTHGLGCARCLVWGIVFEGTICVGAVVGWYLWVSIR
jgi:hypothetical protein